MNNKIDAEINIRDSAFDFKRLVAPIIIDWIGGGEIISIESLAGEKSADIFDAHAGIDAIQIKTEEGIRGIASRIQWREYFKSFTIRYKLKSNKDTEFIKRKRAIKSKSGLFYPYWTSQAYVTERRIGNLLYLCMIKTEDLYNFIKNNTEKIKIKSNPKDGNEFIIVWVNDLKKYHFVHTHENRAEIAKFTNQYDLF